MKGIDNRSCQISDQRAPEKLLCGQEESQNLNKNTQVELIENHSKSGPPSQATVDLQKHAETLMFICIGSTSYPRRRIPLNASWSNHMWN